MQNLDPTYLRYIYDNLIKGSLHPENASELPEGLIGLYEEAFEEHLPVIQRQQLLQRFALFALIKKEVSVAFVSEVLGESEKDTLEFINTYASWFNCPEPGKFQLYHERLKVFVLQKLSEKEIQKIHEKLISHLEKAIEEQKTDEFERYGLEFVVTHLMVHLIEIGPKLYSEEYKKKCDMLREFSVNKKILSRQVEISNGIFWTRDSLYSTILFFLHIQTPIPFEIYENLIDLHKEEEYRMIRLLSSVSKEKYLDVYKTFKYALDGGAIDFQIAVIFYYLIIRDVLDAVFEDKVRILNFFTIEFKNYLFSINKNVFEVIPSVAFIDILIECNKYVENCFERFLLTGYCFIGFDFVEDIRQIEINVNNLQDHIKIFDSLISYFKKKENEDYTLALDVLSFKIYTLLNFDRSNEAEHCVFFEKKQGYFEADDILEFESTIATFKTKDTSSITFTLGFDFELVDFERFNFYTWTIEVIDKLEKNDLYKAKNLMNQIYFNFDEINALIEFLSYRKQTKYLKFIIGNSKGLINDKWDTTWCIDIFNRQNNTAYFESPYHLSSKHDIEKNYELEFIKELSQCIKLDLDEIQRGKLLSTLLNDAYKYSKHLRAIINSVISVIYFNNGENLKSDEYFARTLDYCSKNSRTTQINKFIVFNLTKRHHFELALQYLKDLSEHDNAVQSQILIKEIVKVLGYPQALNWTNRLLEITENKVLVEEIMTILNVHGKQQDVLDIINSLSKSENKFYAYLKLSELNEGNTLYLTNVRSTIPKNYANFNKEILVRLTKSGLLDLVKEICEKNHENNLLYELAGKLTSEKNFIYLVAQFKENKEYTESLTFGFLSKVKYPKIDLSMLSNLIVLNKNSFEICFKLQILYFIDLFYSSTLDLKEFSRLSNKYNLHWAIDIKKQ